MNNFLIHLTLNFSKTPEDYEAQAGFFEIELGEANYHFMRKKFLTYRKSENKLEETWKLKIGKNKGKLHNWNAPALIGWYENGNKDYETYWKNGKKCIGGNKIPAITGWYENGNKMYEIYLDDNKLNRDEKEGPAYISWYENRNKKSEVYYRDDKKHKSEGPAFTVWNENGSKKEEAYYKDGVKIKEIIY